MSTLTMTQEMGAARTRTRMSMVFSVGIHMLLFMWILLAQKITPEEIGITEITWVEPVVEVPAPPPVIAKSEPAPAVRTELVTPSKEEFVERFRRQNPFSTVAPEPQKEQAVEDRLGERLSMLERKATRDPKKIAALTTSNPIGRPALAGVDTDPRSNRTPTDLTRKTTTNPNPVELKRGLPQPQASSMLSMPTKEIEAAPAKIDDSDVNTQRQLAGALLTGQVADRPLLDFRKPEYPEWAKEEAVEGSVTIYFVVLPDGRVKENVMIQKTSGFADFDDNAIKALLTWRFERLKTGNGEQWGTITFHYRLSDVR